MDNKDLLTLLQKEREALKAKIDSLKADLKEAEGKLFPLEQLIAKYDTSAEITVSVDHDGPFVAKTLKGRIREIIANKGKYMRSEEIVETLHPYYTDKTKDVFGRQISSLLSGMNKAKEVIAFGGYGERYFGLPDWVSEDGKPLDNYK